MDILSTDAFTTTRRKVYINIYCHFANQSCICISPFLLLGLWVVPDNKATMDFLPKLKYEIQADRHSLWNRFNEQWRPRKESRRRLLIKTRANSLVLLLLFSPVAQQKSAFLEVVLVSWHLWNVEKLRSKQPMTFSQRQVLSHLFE